MNDLSLPHAYVQHTIFATEDYPGPHNHIGIICEDHIIDIASTVEPHINLFKLDYSIE